MKKRLNAAIAGIVLVLTACGSSPDSTGDDAAENIDEPLAEAVVDDGASGRAAMLQEVFEASDWQIVGRTGFETTPIDGLVKFELFQGEAEFTLEALPCGLWGGSLIEWNDEGFRLVEDGRANFITTPRDCSPRDQLLRLLSPIEPQFFVELSDDGTTATLIKGDRTVTLAAREKAPPPPTTVAPPVTDAPTTTTTTTTEAPAANISTDLASFAPEAGASFSGRWNVVSITVDGSQVSLEAAQPSVGFTGRSLNGTDGCNSFGNAGLVWDDDGSVTIDLGGSNSTAAGCPPEVEEIAMAFFGSLRSADSWGFTPDGNLVFAGPTTRMDLAFSAPAETLESAEIGPIGDTTLQLLREGERFSSLPDDAALPLLTIADDSMTATLSSTDCEITYSATLPPAGEGPVSFDGSDASTCPEGSLSGTVAEILANADYALTLNVEGLALVQLWVGAEPAIFFATEGAGFDG